jgi:hypothetical protein
VTQEDRPSRIKAYADGHVAIVAALSGLAPAQLDQHEPGEWSVRQIVHHLADTEVFRCTRLRRLLAEPEAMILAFDEGRMAELLHYGRPIETSLALFDAGVRSTLELLGLMSDADWARSGLHSEYGAFSMDDWLDRAVAHLPDHAAQIRTNLGLSPETRNGPIGS